MKPLYIESDEEVTSVIDRLRAQSQDENILVVPAGATILQSAINMRLLLREVQKSGKTVAIVTADEYGRTLAEKVGIPVYATMDEIGGDDGPAMTQQHTVATSHEEPRQIQIGSASYFESPADAALPSAAAYAGAPSADEVQLDREWAAASRAAAPVSSRPQGRGMAMDLRSQQNAPQSMPAPAPQPTPVPPAPTPMNSDLPQDAWGSHRDREVQEFFARPRTGGTSSDAPTATPADFGLHGSIAPYAHIPTGMTATKSRRLWIVGVFAGAVIAVVAAAGFVVFYPKVTIILKPIVREEGMTADIIADAARSTADIGSRQIGLTVMEGTLEQTGQYTTSGASAKGSTKARGKVTISNTFSDQAQPLVATTRFLTADGKLFRLISGVTVPGMKGSEPGTVTADVVADQAGDGYNVAPTTFTIPGFKGSPKYEKFTAKSETAFAGGGSGDGAQMTVAADDIARAKKEMEEKVTTALREKMMADAAAQGRKVLSDAIAVTFSESGTSAVEGAVATSFDYRAVGKAKALAFVEDDVRGMVKQELAGRAEEGTHTKDVSLTYSPSLADYEKQTLTIKVSGKMAIYPTIDTAAVRSALAGKKKDDINGILSGVKGVQEAELRYQSGFLMGRLPWYKGSITVQVDEGA